MEWSSSQYPERCDGPLRGVADQHGERSALLDLHAVPLGHRARRRGAGGRCLRQDLRERRGARHSRRTSDAARTGPSLPSRGEAEDAWAVAYLRDGERGLAEALFAAATALGWIKGEGNLLTVAVGPRPADP